MIVIGSHWCAEPQGHLEVINGVRTVARQGYAPKSADHSTAEGGLTCFSFKHVFEFLISKPARYGNCAGM